MRDTLTAMAHHHTRFRRGLIYRHSSDRPHVWRPPVFPLSWLEQADFHVLHRTRPPEIVERPDEETRPPLPPRGPLIIISTLEWLGLLGPPRTQLVMGDELDYPKGVLCLGIRTVLVFWGHRRHWWQLYDTTEERQAAAYWIAQWVSEYSSVSS